MKNRFIILVDLSSDSEHLIQFAYDWGKNIGADMLLVHKTVVMLPALTPYESKKKLTKMANREALDQLRRLAGNILPNVMSVGFFASEKPLVQQLRTFLHGPFNNLVFLGLSKKGLLEKLFIGSEAVKVIDGIDNLIVAVPMNPECCSPETIHVAVQKNSPFNIIDFNKFLNFRNESIQNLVFFSVLETGDDWNDAEKYLRDLTQLYSDRYSAVYEMYKAQSGFQDLKRIILDKKDEFIVVQRGSRMFLDQIFRKFLINDLVYEGNIPLVILP
ncbi:MAG: hypothetical protein FD159_141 [Syntrophaceae bacterium]|nr:MAG: hypothetical protein FD159_141 [Syntrophaceae bacterium]